MKQTMDLNKMGLAPMDELQMQEVNGGLTWWAAAAEVLSGPVGIGLAIIGAVESAQDAVTGFVEGYKLGRSLK